uniref:Photosystem II reaction center protein M n=1 Tax=Eremopyrum triticeum TaxID=58937 RepID=A0A8A6NWZ1_9POAL|nr:photosystem II protein M [Eremopyrum triticeum]QTJ28811.1 photosystem II protein M [Eremopyrum triticeum]
MEVNILAFIATALFILIPTAFLLIIYVSAKIINWNSKLIIEEMKKGLNKKKSKS